MSFTLRELSAIMSAVCMSIGTMWYIYLLVQGNRVKPVVASWIVSSSTLGLSFATYWTNPQHSLVSGVANAVSLVGASSILAVMFWTNQRDGKKLSFSPRQKHCLWFSLAIAILWIIIVWGLKGSGKLPNVLTQVLMIVSYYLTIDKLWNATENTESFLLWGGICVSGLFGFYTASTDRDWFAALYSLRSAACSGFTVWAMYRIVRKTRNVAVA